MSAAGEPRPPWLALWVIVFMGALIWSGYQPKDRFTWWLEVSPALIGALVLLLTRRGFPLTPLVYTLILLHCLILLVGGHYTYSEVPLFDWLRDELALSRNHYDRLGHLAQGLVPALIAREVVIRLRVIERPAWRNFFIVCFCLALSALYELVEWWVVLVSGEEAQAFLAMQGDVWDTQADMGLALLGAVLGLLLLSRRHDRQLAALTG